MFLCDKCHDPTRHFASYSFGSCESCGQHRNCIDCHNLVCKPKRRGGFASMDPAKRSAISKLGGRAAQDKGVAHRWTSAEARDAGIRGAAACARKKKAS